MSFRLAVELPRSVKEIATVAGSLWLDADDLQQPVSLLYITGTEDTFNPIEGGVPITAYGAVIDDTPKPPAKEYIQAWAKQLECTVPPDSIVVSQGVEGVWFNDCRQLSDVIFITVDGPGHIWPAAESLLPHWLIGPPSDKLNATDHIREWFNRR